MSLKSVPFKSAFENRPAEVQVVLLICALGTLRIVIALIVDFLRPQWSIAELVTDFSILLVFISLLFLVYRKVSFKEAHPIFGVFIILLLGINFLQFGGVEGTNCFNYYSGIYVVVMLYAGRTLYSLIFVQLGFLAILVYLVFIKHPFYQSLLIGIDKETSVEFIFSLTAIAVFTFYLKRITLYEIEKSESKSSELNQKVRESKKINRQLVLQSEELKKAQEALKKEVNQRVAALEIRKAAIEQYIHHNTTTLKDPMQQLSTAIDELKEDSQLCTLLRLSHIELTSVIQSINKALQSENNLDRTILEKKLQ